MLGALHGGRGTDHRADGVAVAQALAERGQIRVHPEAGVRPGTRQAEADGGLVEDQQRADAVRLVADVLQVAGVGVLSPARLHHHGSQPVAVLGDDAVEALQVAPLEDLRRAAQLARHAERLQPRHQVAAQRVALAQVGRQVPVVPAVVAADRDHRAVGGRAGDAHRHGHRLAAGARQPHAFRPGVQAAQEIGQLQLLARVERRATPQADAPDHRAGDVRVAEPQDGRADPVRGAVEEVASRLVPHLAAARLAEVGRPLAGRHAVRVLAEQVIAARDDGERALVALLAQLGVDRAQAQQPLRVVAEHVLQVGLVQSEPVGRVQDGAHLLQADLDRLPEEGVVVPLDLVGGDPREAAAERDRAPALV